ncbi:MAG: hypothetical protein A4E53_01787 [Pelotomaculum sp. PtaB.Bin104]|nr:MAG: hypothetical protein A4E53_01787 [Pelotomaculum sp. PtaB.Bin104]
MKNENNIINNQTNVYQLSPGQLNEIYAKYGQPGEFSPGVKATKDRKRLLQTIIWRENQRNNE